MSEIEAGRDLDALIAQTAAGDEWNDVRRDADGDWYGWHIREGETLRDSDSNPAKTYDPIPHYSTNENDASEIFGRFVAAVTDYMNGSPPFTCTIHRDGSVIATATGNTRALAICRAALIASKREAPSELNQNEQI